MWEGVAGLLSNLPNVLTFYNLAILLLGTMGGLILGALPGVSPTMAVALLVPFTFSMDPASGLILLGAVYTSAVSGGAISAVLINVPGAPANIATVLDGYPMARSGKAQAALYTCFTSSFIGGIFGMIVMILLTVPLAEVALKFGSTELFWISILGLSVVAGLSGNLIKSLIAGAFGVWLSMIGPNPMTGEFRFAFHDVFEGGINIIPALIGLFAVPQVFSLVETYGLQRSAVRFTPERGVLGRTIINTFKMFKIQALGSVIGTIIGLIPGVGGQVSGIVSYDQAKKFSKNPERFGTGIPEGIAASESSNNAMVGPSLVPLLTLSVPGSPTAAVLLGGLLIHGLFPGPDLFRFHSGVVHTFIASLLLGQVAMFVFGLVLSRHSHWVMKVPDIYMAASIIVLAVFGTYSVNNSLSDVLIMFGIGLFMYAGGKFGFSAAPVVMGLILGSIAENNFLKGMLIAGAGKGMTSYFFTGGLNIVLMLLCVASIGFGVYNITKGKVKGGPAAKSDVIVSLGVLFLAAALYKYLHVRDPLSGIFPKATLITLGALSLILLVRALMSLRGEKNAQAAKRLFSSPGKVGAAGGCILVYLFALNTLGFYFSSFLFYLVFNSLFVSNSKLVLRRLPATLALSLMFTAVLYLLFNTVLKASPPSGMIF